MAKPPAATDKGFGQSSNSDKKSQAKSNSSAGGNFGFTPNAEVWNGRLAMLGFVAVVLTELITHQGILTFWGLR
ncbi:chlorophyll a/b-binding protein [Phormidium yuhuli]|uniref:chlorophyll a/b-binding protein n=1 Tax=Phormidium yuhuli TaxID=2974039 RepID=UPI002867F1EE|nr:chlorophyll a/b-binding protein [Phormidium yuhuli]